MRINGSKCTWEITAFGVDERAAYDLATPPHMNSPAFTDPAATWNRRFGSEEFLFGTEPNEWLR